MPLDNLNMGVIRFLQLSTVSSDGSPSSNSTNISVGGTEGILFLATCIIAATSDGTNTMQIQYASNSSEGSDAATSNAGFSCTDAIVTFTTAQAIGAVIPLYVNTSRKGFDSRTGSLFPSIAADSVARYSVIAIPFMQHERYPVAQTIATVVADD